MSALPIGTSATRVGILDPDATRRRALCELLRGVGYESLRELREPQSAASDAAAGTLDLIVLDLDEVDDEIVETLAAQLHERPVIGITGDASEPGRRRAAEAGVSDFLVRPLEPAELRLRIANALSAARLRRLLTDRSARLTEAMRDHSAEVGVVRESLSLLAAIADFHDDDTDQHAHRVGALAILIARALALPESFVVMLGDAAPLHDIGKVGISRRILLKPGALTEPERAHMMQHVDIGGQILASAQSDVLVLAAEIARTHHERFDGSGYTAGLAGEEIPLSGRIVAVADVWDTLTHQRPYRQAWEPERALTEIYEQSGAHFDPRVVEAFASVDHLALTPRAASGASAA